MLVFAVCIGVAAFIILNRGGPVERGFVVYLLPWCQLIGAALFVAALVYYLVKRSKSANESGKVITSSFLLASAAVLLAILVSYKFIGTSMVVAFLIAVMVISLTVHFYPASALWLTVFSAVGAALVLAARSPMSSGGIFAVLAVIGKVLAFVWPVFGIIMALRIQKNDGIIKGKNGSYTLFAKDENAMPFVIIGALCIVGAAVACLFSSFASWCAALIAAVYAVFFIIVTVRKVK